MTNCYWCDAEIAEVKYIEWVPLFFRYANVCDKCHNERDIGDTIENIKDYEKVLAGKLHPLQWIKNMEDRKNE